MQTERKLTDVIRDGELDGKPKESTSMGYGKVGDVTVDELNAKTSVYRGISGRCRWDESAGVVSSRTGI